jgi:collagenase-like PrtC family protease
MNRWQSAVNRAVAAEVDAFIIADIGLLDYARQQYPEQRLHLSVQGSATTHEALAFYHREFGITRAVLPRVLSAGTNCGCNTPNPRRN